MAKKFFIVYNSYNKYLRNHCKKSTLDWRIESVARELADFNTGKFRISLVNLAKKVGLKGNKTSDVKKSLKHLAALRILKWHRISRGTMPPFNEYTYLPIHKGKTGAFELEVPFERH